MGAPTESAPPSQIWSLVLALTRSAERHSVTSRDATLLFALRLGFLVPGRDYLVDGLDQIQHAVLADLLFFGLVYRRKQNSRRYYPTPLASQLLSDEPSHTSSKVLAPTV